MVGGDMFKGIVPGLITFGIIIGLMVWGSVELGKLIWGGDGAIRSTLPIEPEIELVIENNKVDTIYVYRQPDQ